MAVNLHIKRKPGESIDKLIKRFSRKVQKNNILENYKESLTFEKPSRKRRREKDLKRYNASNYNK